LVFYIANILIIFVGNNDGGGGDAVAQLVEVLRYCRKVTGPIPDGAIDIFH
jgi:hypothetical protein